MPGVKTPFASTSKYGSPRKIAVKRVVAIKPDQVARPDKANPTGIALVEDTAAQHRIDVVAPGRL